MSQPAEDRAPQVNPGLSADMRLVEQEVAHFIEDIALEVQIAVDKARAEGLSVGQRAEIMQSLMLSLAPRQGMASTIYKKAMVASGATITEFPESRRQRDMRNR